jgi:uncharacterized protein
VIIAEWINENIYVRKQLRRLYQRTATVSTKVVKKARRRKAQKFHQYFDWSEPLSKAPSHRLLAMLRAVNEGFVKLKIEVDVDAAYDTIDDLISKIKIKLRHIYNLLLKIVSRDY